jgi:hypothetical protein
MSIQNTNTLGVKLQLKWVKQDDYEATVSTEFLDTCYQAVSIKLGMPPGMAAGIPEIQYITAVISHDTNGKQCGQIVTWHAQTLANVPSAGKPFGVTAYVVLNNKIVGMDHQKFPR